MAIEICDKRGVARRGVIAVLIAAAFSLISVPSEALAQSWQPLVNRGPFRPGVPLLLTDGSVMVHNILSSAWWKLTPDIHGDYVRGTWTQIASLPAGYGPLAFASAVLVDGRVFVMGGEYNFSPFVQIMTNLGAIYDPALNVWTPIAAPPGWLQIGDAQCTVLPDGRVMLASPTNTDTAILDPVTLTWTLVGIGKIDRHDEEGWTLLPDGTILTVDSIAAPHAERFIPSLGTWISAGDTPTLLTAGQEMGPAVLRPDGTVFATGATGHTAIYTPGAGLTDTGTWTAGPDFPICVGSNCLGQQLGIADGPACLLPNGNVLMGASPALTFPTQFFEFDGTRLNPVPATFFSIANPSFVGNMLMLPSGQVLYTDRHIDINIYTPVGVPQDSWRPAISHAPAAVDPGQTFFVSGTQFNGLSQASVYGDDLTNATNYPLARITNIATGHVFYARTSNHSTRAVATGPATVFTNVTVPLNIEPGPSLLEIVANGIASFPAAIFVGGGNTTPSIQSLAPNAAEADLPAFTLTVNGVKFQPGDVVTWTTAGSPASQTTTLTTTFVSGNQLTAGVPASLVASRGAAFVQVLRADGTVSNVMNFAITTDVPLIQSLAPGNALAGTAGFTLTVNGARFRSGDIVNWTFGAVTTPLPTTFVSTGQVTAGVSPDLILNGGGGCAGGDLGGCTASASITISRANGRVSVPATFTIVSALPLSGISTMFPSQVSAGTPSFTLVLTGFFFAPDSTVIWRVPGGTSVSLTTTLVSLNTLTAVVPASLVAAEGQAGVFVNTPGAGVSINPFPFTITPPPLLPPASLTSISPTTVLAGTPFTMTLKGANFFDGAQVAIEGALVAATVISPTQMSANIPGSAIPLAGGYVVKVVNPRALASGGLSLSVQNPVPRISSLSPDTVTVSSGTFTLTIDGTNFVPSSVARWNGAALATTYVSPTQLQATISSTLLNPSSPDDKNNHPTITVQNPTPGGGGSNGVNLTVN
jgi:hypothetical protein